MDAQGGDDEDAGHLLTWSGPAMRVVNRNGFPRISIDGVERAPLFFTINSQGGLQDFWDDVDYELDLAEQYGNPIVSMLVISNELVGATDISERAKAVFDRIVTHHPRALFLPRIVFHNTNFPKLLLRDRAGAEHSYIWNSVTDAWIRDQELALAETLRRIDRLYPGKLAGVHLAALETNEWFYPVDEGAFADYNDVVGKEFCSWMNVTPEEPAPSG